MAISKFLSPRNDIAFHRIFGEERNKDIIISFVNDILELKNAEKIQDVSFLPPAQNPEISSQKQSIVDILCKNEKGEYIIIEMQVSPTRGFQKRALYYASKTYSKQLNKGQEKDGKYDNLKKVIFIAICDYNLFPTKKGYKSDHIILDKVTFENDLGPCCK